MTPAILFLADPGAQLASQIATARRGSPAAVVHVVTTGATMPGGVGGARQSALSVYGALDFATRLEHARRFSQHWYTVAGEDRSVWDGRSTGAAAEIDFFLFFIRLVEDVDTIRGLLVAETPDAISICTTDNRYYRAIVRMLAPGVSVRCVPQWRGLVRLASGRFWRAWLKQHCLDRWLAFSIHTLLHRLHPALRGRRASQGMHVILLEMVVPSSYDTLMAVYEQLSGDLAAVLSTDPRATMRLLRAGVRPLLLAEGDSRAARTAERRARAALRRSWQALAQSPPALELYGHSLWPLVRQRVADFFRFQAALIVREHRCLDDLARRQQWRTTISSSYLHHFGRLCTVLSDEGGPASVTIQHGVVGAHTYLPMLATRIAVWGDLVQEWFVARGVARERVVVTGQARFERMPARLEAELGHPPLVLVATQPLGGSFQQALVTMLGAMARALPTARFMVRPHPDDPSEPYTALIREMGLTNVSVERGDLLHALVSASVVIVHSSTVGLEALLLQKPLMVFNPFGWPEEVPYVSSEAAIEIRSGEEAIAGLSLLLDDPAARAAAVARAQRFVTGYINFDRRSVERLRGLLDNLKRDELPYVGVQSAGG